MKTSLLLLAALFCLIGLDGAKADLGPKPTIEINLPQSLLGAVVKGRLLLCKSSDCSDAEELEPLGPQRFGCDSKMCSGLAYGFAPYLQLQLELKGGDEITSEVFSKKKFAATFNASLDNGYLTVIEK